jgi:hypothetical protein
MHAKLATHSWHYSRTPRGPNFSPNFLKNILSTHDYIQIYTLKNGPKWTKNREFRTKMPEKYLADHFFRFFAEIAIQNCIR